jgi:hypothetical protein
MAHFFFWSSQYFLFCPQNMNVTRTKLAVSLQKKVAFLSLQGILRCEDCEFFPTHWNAL